MSSSAVHKNTYNVTTLSTPDRKVADCSISDAAKNDDDDNYPSAPSRKVAECYRDGRLDIQQALTSCRHQKISFRHSLREYLTLAVSEKSAKDSSIGKMNKEHNQLANVGVIC